MYLLFLAIWCGVLMSCTTAVPRRRQIKYPVTNTQNSYYERRNPTALEVLERTLLEPGDRRQLHSRLQKKRSANQHHPLTEVELTSPLYFERFDYSTETPPVREKTLKIDGCVASFGDESPLCKPRKRRKKSFLGIPEHHLRPFRSETILSKNMTPMSTTSNAVDDFFGLFAKSSINSPFVKNDSLDSKFSVSPVAEIAPAIVLTTQTTTTSLRTSRNVTAQVTTTQKPNTIDQNPKSTVQTSSLKEETKPSSLNSLSNDEGKIILPGSVQRFELGSQFLYLDHDDNAKNDINTRPIEESQRELNVAVEESEEETTKENSTTIGMTIPTIINSIIPKDSYSKDHCESETKKKCICSFQSVDKDIQTIFDKSRKEEEIMAYVANLKCRNYGPKPSLFNVNTNTKPRVLKKGKNSPFPLDDRKGAKEVTEQSLQEFIASNAFDDGVKRVFMSMDVKIPCFPKPDIHLSSTEADHVTFTWTHGNQKEAITQGRITVEAAGDGSLMIEDIQLTDAMNYTCEVDYVHPDIGVRTTDVFVHTLEVVMLPIGSVRGIVHYKSAAVCDESLLEMFELYLPQQVEEAMCHPESGRLQLCSVVVHSPVCHSGSQEKPENETAENPQEISREKREGSMEMSLNYDVFVHKHGTKVLPGGKSALCDPECHLLISFKLLQFFKESMAEIIHTPIKLNVKGGGTFTPVESSVKLKYIFGCMGGYYLDNGFCLACPKGTYSDDGATECTKCPSFTYSGAVGTRKCTPCKHLWVPICNEIVQTFNIKIILYVLFAVSVVILGFILYYVFCFKKRTWREVFKRPPKEKLAKSERIRRKKTEKQKSKMKKAEDMKSLLVTSEESGSDFESGTKKTKQIKDVSSATDVSATVSNIENFGTPKTLKRK